MEKLPVPSPAKTGITTLETAVNLREQPDQPGTKMHIADLLDRLAILYQIPKWDQLNAILLTDWIIETYPNEPIEVITRALTRPRKVEKTWRLTPDTITEWMEFEIERYASNRERDIHNAKVIENKDLEWTDDQLKQWQKVIDLSEGFKRGPRMTDDEARKEGGVRPKLPNYTPPDESYVNAYYLHIEWIRENYDSHSGKPKDSWISEDEWLKKRV